MTDKRTVTIQDLTEFLQNSDHVLLDVRPIAAYNGWALCRELRGGHIKGARAFPLEWTETENWPELLVKKGITGDKPIVVYGYSDADSKRMDAKLADIGFKHVSRFDGFKEWSNESILAMDQLKRYHQLVYPEWVRSLITGGRPPHYDGQDFVICHASFRYREDYESGHIPGAIHLDTELLEESRTWNRRSPEELRQACLDLGINRDTMVVLYGRFSHPNNQDEYPGKLAGHLAAMRCAHIMMYAGVKDVRVLNGGMATWNAAGFEVTQEEGEVVPVKGFGAEIPQHPELIIDTPEARELLASGDGELVSIRSWEEFIGSVSGYNYIDKIGRIPGAVFGNCGSDAYHMENYRNVDHTIREYHEIAQAWATDGIVPQKHIGFYCGTGWRASEAFMNAYLMGWPRISVYDGGWLEWSSDPDNPVATGEPEVQRPVW